MRLAQDRLVTQKFYLNKNISLGGEFDVWVLGGWGGGENSPHVLNVHTLLAVLLGGSYPYLPAQAALVTKFIALSLPW